MSDTPLPPSVERKIELLFHGVRYSEALGAAARHAFPNFHPYRFKPGEVDPTGQGKAAIPYLMRLDDGTVVRVLGDSQSPWSVAGDGDAGYRLQHREDPTLQARVDFAPRPRWLDLQTDDGMSMAAAGVSLHGDMAVVNIAPGCQYFLPDPDTGDASRCTFCTYGAPDARMRMLGQDIEATALPELAYRRLAQSLDAMLTESPLRHIYLVGGSLRDWHAEGDRFIALAREVQAVVQRRVPVTCGSGALPEPALTRLHEEALVDSICFNLEVWPRWLFQRVCPGKQRYVGYERWIASLESAVSRWGRGRVYSAMVAGIELEPEFGMSWREAVDGALEGAEDLCRRGIIPIYSLYWPLGGRERAGYLGDLMAYFRHLNVGCRAIRERHGLAIWDGFMCHRCAYMQLECDMDRAPRGTPGT
jgi:hypothetical protein